MDMTSFHWAMNILQEMDTGLVVVDRSYKIAMWNAFMENHSGKGAEDVHDKVLFDVFPELQREWFQRKIDTVFMLDSRAYTIWEERPYVFRFENYRPITGKVEFMYQYTTLIPLKDSHGSTGHVGILINDVTDAASQRIELMNLQSQHARA